MKILLVGDQKINRSALATLLVEEPGAEVHPCNNGIEGIKAFRELDFDFLIVDIDMPHMDGIEMVKQVRETDKEVKIITMRRFVNDML